MSMETVSTKKNRVYPRKFDHDEARRLYIMEGLGYVLLARRYGVSTTAIARVVNPVQRERLERNTKRWLMSGECKACGGPTVREGIHRRAQPPTGLCRKCWGESQQTRFRFDELGQLAAIRCTTCQTWKDADLFPASQGSARDKHAQCRSCGTKARNDYRQRQKVPCTFCGEPCLPAKEKGTSGFPLPRCKLCFYAWLKVQQRRKSEEPPK